MYEEFDVEVYSTLEGKEPFTEWLESLKDKVVKKTILVRIQRMRQGNFGDCEGVGDGVQELKIHLGSGFRVYFSKIGKRLILLLGGGIKRSQDKDIEKCINYLEDYRRS
jgi:putative addiction module killer protein